MIGSNEVYSFRRQVKSVCVGISGGYPKSLLPVNRGFEGVKSTTPCISSIYGESNSISQVRPSYISSKAATLPLLKIA